MRFKASIRNIRTFEKFAASLSSLGRVAWVRLEDEQLRFTVIPEKGTQVWAVLSIDTIFETYTLQSAAPNNTINLELPLPPFHRALRSAVGATSATLRLTKKDNIPLLSLTIVTSTFSHASRVPITVDDEADGFGNGENGQEARVNLERGPDGLRETTIEQDVPVRVLRAVDVEGIHEPRCREPDVHILLPSLVQLKAISERFTKLALATSKTTSTSTTLTGLGTAGPRLELSANMHGSLKMSIKTDALRIESLWTGLVNPELDPGAVEGGEEGLRTHPSVRMKELEGEEGWARCRIDGKDWGRVLSVGRMGGRVIACFCHEHALILYVYIPNDEDGADESVLTYYISCYSA